MTNENSQKLKIPAIGLIIVAILNILFGLFSLFRAITLAYKGIDFQKFTSEQEKLAFQVGFYGVIFIGILSLVVAPIIISGALKMMRGEVSGKTKLAAILAMIPVLSISFLLGIPFGIYALMIMNRIKSGDNSKIEN